VAGRILVLVLARLFIAVRILELIVNKEARTAFRASVPNTATLTTLYYKLKRLRKNYGQYAH
jgi:hypothetical protein